MEELRDLPPITDGWVSRTHMAPFLRCSPFSNPRLVSEEKWEAGRRGVCVGRAPASLGLAAGESNFSTGWGGEGFLKQQPRHLAS